MTDLEILEESVCDDLIIKEFLEYALLDDSHYLCESKAGDSLRWRLAKFSLRFLTEESLDEFLTAYNKKKTANKKAHIDIKSLKKKEKVSKLRSIFDSAPQEVKDKIINSPEAKDAEKSALKSSAIGAIVIGGGTGVALTINPQLSGFFFYTLPIGGLALTGNKKSKGKEEDKDNEKDKTVEKKSMTTKEKISLGVATSLLALLGVLSGLAMFMFGVMWGFVIIGGALSTYATVSNLHKANTLRRDEMIHELIGSKEQ